MKIQIANTLLQKETHDDWFLPRSFFQSGNRLFFIADYVSQTFFNVSTDAFSFYSAIELTKEDENFSLSDEVVILKVDNHTEELLEVLPLETIPEQDQDTVWVEAFEWLFITLRSERGEVHAVYSKDIVTVLYRALKLYLYKTSVFKSGKKIEVGLLDGFKLTAEATVGHYEGNVLFTDWKIIEIYSEQNVANFEDTQLPHQLFIEEEDSVDDTLEALVDSISREDILSLALERLTIT
jgi:hypothetical protein